MPPVKSGGESAMISALLCRLPIALSQATSSAVKGGIVVVVGGGVVLVLAVLGVDAAVELAVLPPHPVASTVTVRQTARRAGVGMLEAEEQGSRVSIYWHLARRRAAPPPSRTCVAGSPGWGCCTTQVVRWQDRSISVSQEALLN